MKVMASTIWVFRRILQLQFLRQYDGRSVQESRPDPEQPPVRYSSLTKAASVAALPYSFSLLCRVFRLMPRISAARVLLLLVASMVFRISRRSASSTVVPTPRWIASGSSDDVRIVA